MVRVHSKVLYKATTAVKCVNTNIDAIRTLWAKNTLTVCSVVSFPPLSFVSFVFHPWQIGLEIVIISRLSCFHKAHPVARVSYRPKVRGPSIELFASIRRQTYVILKGEFYIKIYIISSLLFRKYVVFVYSNSGWYE